MANFVTTYVMTCLCLVLAVVCGMDNETCLHLHMITQAALLAGFPRIIFRRNSCNNAYIGTNILHAKDNWTLHLRHAQYHR